MGVGVKSGSKSILQWQRNFLKAVGDPEWVMFLAVHNSSIGHLVPPLVGLTKLTIRVFTTLQSEPRDLWPLRHLIRGMRRHYYLPANLPTYLPTYLHMETLWASPTRQNKVLWKVETQTAGIKDGKEQKAFDPTPPLTSFLLQRMCVLVQFYYQIYSQYKGKFAT